MIGTLNFRSVLVFGLIFFEKPGYLHPFDYISFYINNLIGVQMGCRWGAGGCRWGADSTQFFNLHPMRFQ